MEVTKLTTIVDRIDHFQRIPAISSLLLSNESLANFNRKRALVIPLNYNLLDSQNNLTHVNRVICAKDGAKVTRHVRSHEWN